MKMQEFAERYGQKAWPIKEIVESWVLEKQVNDLLGMRIAGGTILLDHFVGEELADSVPQSVRAAFEELMKAKADSLYEVKKLLLEKAELGQQSLESLKNKIQGTMGELKFKSEVSTLRWKAELARSGSQPGWDVKVPIPGTDEWRYVQVKVYGDASQAVHELRELDTKIQSGRIFNEHGQPMPSVEFAVNDEIYDEVKRQAEEQGIGLPILKIGATREEFRDALDAASENVTTPLDNFFSELSGGILTGAALHAAANAYLFWKGAKERNAAIEDTLYSSAVSAGGMIASFTVEGLLARAFLIGEIESAAAVLASPVGTLALAGIAIYTRGVLKRLADRRNVARRLATGNIKLVQLALSFA